MENYELIHNPEKKCYEFHIDNFMPLIEYIKTKSGDVYLTHTEVPTELEGKGIGKQLVEKTLADIEKQGLKIVPLCPFVAAFVKRNPEWMRIVTERK